MLAQVRAAVPKLLELTLASKYASEATYSVSTEFEKKAHLVNLDEINTRLVSEVVKLGSSVLKSIEASTVQDELKDSDNNKKRDESKEMSGEGLKKSAVSLRDALLIGGGISAVPALAANYTLNKASDDLDSKMLAIPGIAAATVGAILAARQASKQSTPPNPEISKELEGAINARTVLENASSSDGVDSELASSLSKLSSINTDHIAQLVTALLQ
jgi:hypothetical protein